MLPHRPGIAVSDYLILSFETDNIRPKVCCRTLAAVLARKVSAVENKKHGGGEEWDIALVCVCVCVCVV